MTDDEINESMAKDPAAYSNMREHSRWLKPCPFCGESEVRVESTMDGCIVVCTNRFCLGQSGWHPMQADAEKAWNRRASYYRILCEQLARAYTAERTGRLSGVQLGDEDMAAQRKSADEVLDLLRNPE